MTPEALSLITEELAMVSSQVSTMAPKLENISKTLERIESLLVQRLREDAQADDQAQRRQVVVNERFERIEKRLQLRPA